jgi:F0F1-type ATP synthase assembly protein I
MKKIILAISALAIAFTSCKKAVMPIPVALVQALKIQLVWPLTIKDKSG